MNSSYDISASPLLPHNDQNRVEREKNIQKIRQEYETKNEVGFPIKLKKLPQAEKFSIYYTMELGLRKAVLKSQNWISRCTASEWNKLDDLNNIYHICILTLPKASQCWQEDEWFGYQRLNRCNPKLIKLCEEIPSKLDVNEEMMKPVLNGETLEGLKKRKRLFYTDLEILEDITPKNGLLCAPIALFMLDSEDNLVPIAIQLQQKKGSDNPVFLPTDNYYVWTLAKIWYNMADANYHQALTHLGLTHLLMQVVIVYMRRNISVSHPVYKLLAPHTFYLMAINDLAFDRLIAKGGWVDQTMAVGSSGMLKLVGKGLKKWDFFNDGIPANDFVKRGVDDPKVLPKYYFRDDSIALFDCIYKYVSKYIDIYYETNDDITKDCEIQNWVKSMVGDGHLQGLPMKDGKGHVSSKEELEKILAVIIFNCSVTHAAVNFLQYEEYGFPPNYPPMLRTPLLKDKAPRTEEDILKALPDKETVFSVIAVTYLLSTRATNSLGYFETQYNFDEKAVKCVTDFQSDLQKVSEKIKTRNQSLETPYEILDPVNIPNAISI